MKTEFYPVTTAISKQKILEIINSELDMWDKDQIEIDDERLTDEFCQEMANDWISCEEFPEFGDLWLDEDSISDEWSDKILKQFS